MATQTAQNVRPPAVAGLFYPGEKDSLSGEITGLLRGATARAAAVPKALIAPHAGYIYSGPVAASAYALLAPARDTITRVVLLGPTHRVAVRGLALPSVAHFATPLGAIELDQAALDKLEAMPQVVVNDDAHALEHSLEVHVPFLQKMLSRFKLVPLAVGYAEPHDVAAVLDEVWGGAETLIVVSSDLSHYLAYRQAQAIDRATSQAIVELRTDIDHDQACGASAVCGLALAARRRQLKSELLDLRNSGDTAGDKNRVVGYGAFAFYEI
jgi:AmmeMemoRadiSam system protein B